MVGDKRASDRRPETQATEKARLLPSPGQRESQGDGE